LSTGTLGVKRAFVLWISGARLADIHVLDEVKKLKRQGTLVELEPLPITGPLAQHYQLFSGQSPAHFGFFDTLIPSCKLPQWQQNDGYEVAETESGHNVATKMLPDLLRTAGWDVAFEETSLAQLVACVRGLTRMEEISNAPTCHIVKCTIGMADQSGMQNAASLQAIAEAMRAASSWAGQAGLLALLSDIQPAPVERYININNFLSEMGILNRDGQSGLIDWQNSLAYYAGNGQIWINVLGRDPLGVVHPQGEYEEVRDTLVKSLPTKLHDVGTGLPLLERIYFKEEFYPEQYLFCAPDLVVVFKPGYAPSPASTHLKFDGMTCYTPAERSVTMAGAHPSTLKGFLLMSAPSIVSGSILPASAPLTSALPTLLHALGVEYDNMDGRVLVELFSPTYLETHPVRTTLKDGELSEEDEELIINRLRDLGYV
jgi:hypothetical protein